MRFLKELIESFTGSSRRRQNILDLLLMAGLADGDLGERDLDRIARALELREELDGLKWQDVIERMTEIEAEAPDFQAARERIKKSIKGDHTNFAISLAAQLLGPPLSEDERNLLLSVASDLGIPQKEQDDLLEPWADTDPLSTRYVRCIYNHPDRARDESIFDAMAHAQDDIELAFFLVAFRFLMYKFRRGYLGSESVQN